MFKNLIRVEVEPFGFCNRKCSWCPNAEFDRTKNCDVMDLNIFEQLILDLKANGFGSPTRENDFVRLSKSTISFNGYCEPMSNVSVIKYLTNRVNKIFGTDVDVVFNTNGDYLTKDAILQVSNVDKVTIMDYEGKGRDYWNKKLTDLEIIPIKQTIDAIYAIHNDIDYIKVQLSWEKTELENRGGYFDISRDLETQSGSMCWKNAGDNRKEPCIDPMFYISISHTGDVMPCCHLRYDNPEHKKFIMGNIKDENLSQIVSSKKFKTFQYDVFNMMFPEVCRNCHKQRDFKKHGIGNDGKMGFEFNE